MGQFPNDGSGRAPRLEAFQSLWGMSELPAGERFWSLEEQFERIAEAGFAGVDAVDVPPPAEADRWRRLLERYDLKLGIHAFPKRAEQLEPIARRARDFGAVYINGQLEDYFVVGQDAIDELRRMIDIAAGYGVPLVIETHRATATQDVLRTLEYLRALPELNLGIDISHYVLAGEVIEPSPQIEAAFAEILARTAQIDGRVSSGEQIQVDVGDGTAGPIVHFRRWWTAGMRAWRERAGPGDYLPFVPELGPPTYGLSLPGADGASLGAETSDRWAQALVLKRVAEECWASLG